MDNTLLLENALKMALPEEGPQPGDTPMTQERTLTRRGVVWLGQTCNLHCSFCYFYNKIHDLDNIEHDFMSLDKAKKICDTLANVYGNTAIDIQGGEPTIYKHIFELVAHCVQIGLKPTLITNALVLANKERCRAFQKAGVNDFLISMHGLGDTHDSLVGVKGAHEKQMKAIRNLIELDIPFRFNCVLTRSVLSQLRQIAEFAVQTCPKAVNFIAFNPFDDQSRYGLRTAENVPRYKDIKGALSQALDVLSDRGIEVNVRYLPFCMLEERHRMSCYNFQQLSYDHHEWDYVSWSWTGLLEQRIRHGDISPPFNSAHARWLVKMKRPIKWMLKNSIIKQIVFSVYSTFFTRNHLETQSEERYQELAKIHAKEHCNYSYGNRCESCSVVEICDGFHGDYAGFFGTEEAEPISGDKITDPLHYIRRQPKVIL